MKLNNISSLTGVLLGAFFAAADYHINILSAICLVIAAIFLQILSDICRSHDAGRMKTVFLLLFIISGLASIWLSFGTLLLMESLVLIVIGYFSIRFAMNSTVVSSPGTGDIYRLLLYGPAALYGSFFVCSHSFASLIHLLPAVAAGVFAIAVMGTGQKRSQKIYRSLMIIAGWICMLVFSFMRIFDIMHFLYVLTLPLFIWHSVLMWKDSERSHVVLSVSVALFALLTGTGYVAFLF